MLLPSLSRRSDSFLPPSTFDSSLRLLMDRGHATAPAGSLQRITLGASEEGRDIDLFRFGRGPLQVSLMAGAHADEPVGPETLRRLLLDLANSTGAFSEMGLLFTLHIVPHVNPDGEARNADWRVEWPDPASYILKAIREPPGRDIEFGYPDLRPENTAAAAYWREQGPFSLHVNLHGMGFSDGAMLLIERHWAGRTQPLRDAFSSLVKTHGLQLHDHNRKGEKGFFQIEPGFTTTPEGAMMRAHFEGLGDTSQAARFRDSSMEFMRSLGGDPLCLVTELPLFLVDGPRGPGNPEAYLNWKRILPDIRRRLATREPAWSLIGDAPLRPLEIDVAVNIQYEVIRMGLEIVAESARR